LLIGRLLFSDSSTILLLSWYFVVVGTENVRVNLLRGIVNNSNSESQLDSDRNIVNNRLSDTNCYEVLEKYEVRLE